MSEPLPAKAFIDYLLEWELIVSACHVKFQDKVWDVIDRARHGDASDFLEWFDWWRQNDLGDIIKEYEGLALGNNTFKIRIYEAGPLYWIRAEGFDDIGYFDCYWDAINHLENKYHSQIDALIDREQVAACLEGALGKDAAAQVELGHRYEYGDDVKKSYAEAAKWYRKAAEQGDAEGQCRLADLFSDRSKVGKRDYAEAANWYRKAAEQGHAEAQRSLGALLLAGLGVARDPVQGCKLLLLAGGTCETKSEYESLTSSELSEAKYLVGIAYLNGEGTAKSHDKAREWLAKAAAEGHAAAQYSLGRIYDLRLGVARDCVEAAKWYRKAAEQGYLDAQITLALMLETGRGIAQNLDEAILWHQKAAEQGHIRTQLELAHAYESGIHVSQNYAQAAKWFRKAADLGNAEAQYSLGAMAEEGKGMPQDFTEAAAWYEKAAAQNHSIAQWRLGCLLERMGSAPELVAAWYRKAAEQGHADAQFSLGVMLQEGEGIAQDYNEALTLYGMAAEQEHAEAKYALSYLYYMGIGVEKDVATASRHCHEAAVLGDSDAQYMLGCMCRSGQGVEQSYTEAANWYRKAAEQGHAEAQLMLGKLYEKGQGVKQSHATAIRWFLAAANQDHVASQLYLAARLENEDSESAVLWYQRAAEHGDPVAQRKYGEVLENGRGTKPDCLAAAVWYRKAAEQGDSESQYALGRIHQDGGSGVAQDFYQAYVWLNIATATLPHQDREDAMKRRDRVSALMSGPQLISAQQEAKQMLQRINKE